MYTKTSKTWRSILMTVSSAVMILFGMGSSCPESGTVKFKNTGVAALRASSTLSRSWYTGRFADVTAGGGSSVEHNLSSAGIPADNGFPIGVISNSDRQFMTFFNRYDGTNAADLYTGLNPNITSYSWAPSTSNFTRLFDVRANDEALNSKVAVDSLGNVMSVSIVASSGGGNNRMPVANRHNVFSGVWSTGTELGDTAVAADALDSLDVKADSYNNFIVAWVQSTSCYFNEYRPNLGWRFNSTTGFGSATWHVAGHAPAAGTGGASVGFDSYGNGIGAYTSSAGEIIAVRWRNDTTTNFDTTLWQDLSVGTIYGFPKVIVMPDGAATVFYYSNNAGGLADLYYVSRSAGSSATSLGFSTPASIFGSSDGTGKVRMFPSALTVGQIIEPMTAQSGNYAAAAFIKSDGVTYRLYVYRYYNGTWTRFGTADHATAGDNVNFASIAVNSSGDIAVAYAVDSVTDGSKEHVYGNVYTNGAWQGATRLDDSGLLTMATGIYSRPNVAMDSVGNVTVVFSADDTTTNCGGASCRRIVTAGYY